MNDAIWEASVLTSNFLENIQPDERTALSAKAKPYLYLRQFWQLTHNGAARELLWFPGVHWESSNVEEPCGPLGRTDVVCVLDWPEHNTHSVYCTYPWMDMIRNMLIGSEQEGYAGWYFTPLIKFSPNFYTQSSIPAAWFKTCKPFFDAELEITRPKYVVCFSTHVAKHILGVSKMSVEDSLRRTYPVEYALPTGEVLNFELLVCPGIRSLTDNRQAARAQELTMIQLKYLKKVVHGEDTFIPYHRIIRDASDLKAEVNRIMELAKTEPKRRIIALDHEWDMQYPEQTGARLLTIQFSSWPGEACTVVLEDENGETFKPNVKAAVKELNRLLTWHDDWRPRVGGHFLRSDLPWALHLGLTGTEGKDILWSYAPPKDLEACRTEGGWDTSLMYHAYNEKESYGLKYIAAKELGTPRYEAELVEFLDDFIVRNKMKKSDLTGFGCVPDRILHPYGAWDADVTRCIAELCMFGSKDIPYCEDKERPALLDCDMFGCDNWKPYWLAHRASLGFLDIEHTGIMLDRERFAELSNTVAMVYDVLLDELRRQINWPDFNPKSTQHKQGLLFGRRFAETTTSKGTKNPMPEDAVSLNLPPEYATKTRRMWDTDDTVDEDGNSPASDKVVLNLLALRNPVVKLLKDVCRLKTMLSAPLSMPYSYWDDKGEHILYPNGLYAAMREDGAIHSNMRTLCATGRASSTKPNMQNTTGKSAEPEVMRIMGYEDEDGEHGDYLDLLGGPRYKFSVHSVLKARPDHVFIEPDFTGAELAVMAWMSGDVRMIEHVRRNALPEDDPEYYDMHSNIAVKAFRLQCEPTKKGLASIHAKHLRIAAKAIAFGIPYGRGAKAIALQCRSQGIDLTDKEAEGLVDAYHSEYPKVKEFLNDCKRRVDIHNADTRYVESLFGRRRRFPLMNPDDMPEDLQAAEKREACNAPIQATVADAMNVAIYNFVKYRYQHPEIRFKIVMQIHDALLLEVHKDDASFVYNYLIKKCMVDDNPIISKGPNGPETHHFATDADVSVYWGEELTEETAQKELNCSLSHILDKREDDISRLS